MFPSPALVYNTPLIMSMQIFHSQTIRNITLEIEPYSLITSTHFNKPASTPRPGGQVAIVPQNFQNAINFYEIDENTFTRP